MIMGLSWILAGALVAWIATKKINLRGDDPIVDYGIGVGGAFVGGLVCHFIVGGPMASFSVWCLVAAFVTSGEPAARVARAAEDPHIAGEPNQVTSAQAPQPPYFCLASSSPQRA